MVYKFVPEYRESDHGDVVGEFTKEVYHRMSWSVNDVLTIYAANKILSLVKAIHHV